MPTSSDRGNISKAVSQVRGGKSASMPMTTNSSTGKDGNAGRGSQVKR